VRVWEITAGVQIKHETSSLLIRRLKRSPASTCNNSHAIGKIDLLEQHLIKVGEVTGLRRQQSTKPKPKEQRTEAQSFFTGTGNPNALSRDSSRTSRSSADGRETGAQQERRPRRRTGTWRQLESGSTVAHEKSTGGLRAALAAKPRGRNTQIGSALATQLEKQLRRKLADEETCSRAGTDGAHKLET
jgi:hypothetical protein